MKIPPLNLKGSPLAAVEFTFCQVSPELAAEWLKANTKNRRAKAPTVESYATDMRNGQFLTTHQGIAFNAAGRLIDGQHRLLAIVAAKRPVTLLVSTGWPEGGKVKTMDAVDRGVQRSLADQLGVQHDVADAKYVVQIANAIVANCLGGQRVFKSTPATIIEVVTLYRDGIKFILEHRPKQPGVRQAFVLGSIAMLHQHFPEKTGEIVERLESGENLNRENALLWLRNWLMSSAWPDTLMLRHTIFHHCIEYIEGRALKSLVTNSHNAYHRILRLSEARVRKVCSLYNRPVPEAIKGEADNLIVRNISPISAEAMELMKTLGATFSGRDVAARLEDGRNAGNWLTVWQNKGWIESSGLEWRKTALWGAAK